MTGGTVCPRERSRRGTAYPEHAVYCGWHIRPVVHAFGTRGGGDFRADDRTAMGASSCRERTSLARLGERGKEWIQEAVVRTPFVYQSGFLSVSFPAVPTSSFHISSTLLYEPPIEFFPATGCVGGMAPAQPLLFVLKSQKSAQPPTAKLTGSNS